MLTDVFEIIGQVIVPVFVILGLGFLIQRWKGLDLKTLAVFNIYLLSPCYLFVRVFQSELALSEIGRLGITVLSCISATCLLSWLVLWCLGTPSRTTATFVMAAGLFNGANFGIPVAELAFGEEGATLQVMIVLFISLTSFAIAYPILAAGQGQDWRSSILSFLKLPHFYVVFAAIVLRDCQISIPDPLMGGLERLKDGLIPIALTTLGAQLAQNANWPKWAIVAPLVVVKLLIMPLIMTMTVWLFGLWPMPGAVLILAAGAPTAVNTVLMCVDVDGEAGLAGDFVFWTTAFSCLTVAVLLAILRSFL